MKMFVLSVYQFLHGIREGFDKIKIINSKNTMAVDDSNKSKTDGESIDANSPYYLHPSDYPKQLQVNENLTENNFNDWSQEMTNFLLATDEIGFVDGSLLKPNKSDGKYMPWMRCDAMIKGWLTPAMDKEI